MPVQIESIESEVAVSGAPAATGPSPAGGGTAAPAPTAGGPGGPNWEERARYRRLAALAARDAARLAGEGFGA